MAEDLEVGVTLVVDDEELQNIQDQELGVGGAGQDDSFELDEERNERLQQVNRGVGRVAGKLGILTAVAASLALLAKTVGEIFDISFSDVRNALVNILSDLKDSFANFIQKIPTGLASAVVGEETANRAQGAAIGGMFGLPGMLVGALLGDHDTGGSASGSQNLNISLLTSRDQLTGDSTQQEQTSQYSDEFNLVGGGSGGSVPE